MKTSDVSRQNGPQWHNYSSEEGERESEGGVKERPILFSAPMVRAILQGRKTQTRRIVKPQPFELPEGAYCDPYHGDFDHFTFWTRDDRMILSAGGNVPNTAHWRCQYGQPGNRLLVASEIPGIPDTYCAGSNGVIYSRARDRSVWKPLKPWRQKKGYQTVTIMAGGRKRSLTVHSLVCSAFYGPAPFTGAQVRHLDGNPENGFPENLAWGTQEENWLDRKAHGNGCEGDKHHASKFSNEERAHIRWAVENGLCSQRHAARALGVTQSSIGQLMKGCELLSRIVELGTRAENRVSPITLEITGLRVERLQDISEEDAKTEGAEALLSGHHDNGDPIRTHRTGFVKLWRSLESDDVSTSWSGNPWVWVIEFRRAE